MGGAANAGVHDAAGSFRRAGGWSAPIHHAILSLILLSICEPEGCFCITAASSVVVEPNGEQQQRRPKENDDGSFWEQFDKEPPEKARPTIKATFANALPATSVNLYSAGDANSMSQGSLRAYHGPLHPKTQMIVDAHEGQSFVLTRVGTYERLGEYVIGGGMETTRHILTEEDANRFLESFPPNSTDSEQREKSSHLCRSLNGVANSNHDNNGSAASNGFSDRCKRCANVGGCGFSPVRDRLREADGVGAGGCYAAHATATVDDIDECQRLSEVEEAGKHSVDDWLRRAKALVAYSRGGSDLEPGAMRLAYRCGERAVERSDQMLASARGGKMEDEKVAEDWNTKAKAALRELSAKLEAVYDDIDMAELLASTSHPRLSEVHPDIPAVPRRTTKDAIPYILRGEPVVVTDMFTNGSSKPGDAVAKKWTLDYLREAFGDVAGPTPKFYVATDEDTKCCRYFEPRHKSQQMNYPYPFAPSAHVYLDSFEGYVDAVRGSNYNAINAGKNSSKPRLLHYLHENIVFDGEVSISGWKAPERFVADIDDLASRLRPLALKGPFFGDFAYGKMWLGQKGIIMPMHYDAGADNLYVMAWGRKRVIIGEPGQLDTFYRYPNSHPFAGQSQVNLTDPNLEKYPHFQEAKLREAVLGPGDVFYLPAWWWHQFEQPFEDTATVNLWSKDADKAPISDIRDTNIREFLLAHLLEESVVALLGRRDAKLAGVCFNSLAHGKDSPHYASINPEKLKQARRAMLDAANQWKQVVSKEMPGGHPKLRQPAAVLVDEYLDRTHRNLMEEKDVNDGWRPGDAWDLSRAATLPPELKTRCRATEESTSPYMSVCHPTDG